MPSPITERHDLSGGHFTIEGQPLRSVLDMIAEWENGPHGNRFLYLDAHECGSSRGDEKKNRVMINFRYQLSSSNPRREQKQFVYTYTDMMRRRFGNGLVAWSVASPVYVAS